jgi:hypothetical protein
MANGVDWAIDGIMSFIGACVTSLYETIQTLCGSFSSP